MDAEGGCVHPAETLPLAVRVDGLTKAFGRSPNVFEDVHLHLPTGNIFGLLGPSGCGKTTLLRCILGRLQPDHGTILIFGHATGTKDSGVPGPNVGYMPQETCIYETMTIGECLRYYGRLARMDEWRIATATKHILNVLNLPSQSTLNSALSGGQLRRVAFAVAVLHEPKLLILDEPTVGIDPINKEGMWQHLHKLSQTNGMSIIITTHYIEEARAAHKLGLMHGRRMVEEEYTDRLLAKYGCPTLEEVFLQICHSTKATSSKAEVVRKVRSCPKHVVATLAEVQKTILPEARDLRVRPKAIWAIFVKNFINIYRFPGAFLFLLMLPFVQVASTLYAVGGTIHGLTVAVVNEDSGHLGETYLSKLNPHVLKPVPYPTFQDGLMAARNGKAYGLIGIGPNFSEAFHLRLLDGLLQHGDVLDHSRISVSLDDCNFLIRHVVRFHILDAFLFFQNSVIRNDTEANPLVAELPIQFDQKAMEFLEVPSAFLILLGMMVGTAFFAPVGVVIFSLYIERIKGHLERTCIAGVSALEIILGLMALLVAMLVVQICLLMIPVFWTLENMNAGSSILVGLILFFEGITGIGFGLCVALLVDQIVIVLLATGLAMATAPALAGYVWPLQALPLFLQSVYRASPVTCQVQAIIAAVVRGWGMQHAEVQWGIWSSILWAVVLGALTLVLFRMKV